MCNIKFAELNVFSDWYSIARQVFWLDVYIWGRRDECHKFALFTLYAKSEKLRMNMWSLLLYTWAASWSLTRLSFSWCFLRNHAWHNTTWHYLIWQLKKGKKKKTVFSSNGFLTTMHVSTSVYKLGVQMTNSFYEIFNCIFTWFSFSHSWM